MYVVLRFMVTLIWDTHVEEFDDPVGISCVMAGVGDHYDRGTRFVQLGK